MGYYFGILTVIGARMVGDYAIFTEVRESKLDLIRFSNQLCYTWRMG
jgi:hypothetical protein